MCSISNPTRSNSNGETSWEGGDFAKTFDGKNNYQDLIDQANTVPILKIFKAYSINIDIHNRKIVCPFKHHKNGRESTPSFWFYPETNSFCCYGCNTGGKSSHGCEFVAAMENISRHKAANKILHSFSSLVDKDNIHKAVNFSEQLEIMMLFSNMVREFRQSFFDEQTFNFIDKICFIYDKHNLKRDLDNEALREVYLQTKNMIDIYISIHKGQK